MRVLFYWHDAALPSSTYILEALDRAPGVTEVLALAPRRARVESIFTIPSDTVPVYSCTKVVEVASYSAQETWCRLGEWLRHVKAFRPDLLIVLDEALSVNVLLASIANRLTNPSGRVLFYGFENIQSRLGFVGFCKNPGLSSLLGMIRKTVRYAIFDRLPMPVRRAFVHGGLFAYKECGDVIRSSGWSPPMVEQWWGINAAVFRPDGPVAECDLPSGLFRIGFVGRFIAAKGLFDLIEAVHVLGSEYGLLLVGDGELKGEIEAKIARLGIGDRVRLIPPRNHSALAEIYRGLDLLVLPSHTELYWKEQFGRVLIEAMRCGTPVIGSSSGAIPYVVKDPDRVFAEGDVNALADCIRRSRLAGRPTDFDAQIRGTSADEFIQAFIRLGQKLSAGSAATFGVETLRPQE